MFAGICLSNVVVCFGIVGLLEKNRLKYNSSNQKTIKPKMWYNPQYDLVCTIEWSAVHVHCSLWQFSVDCLRKSHQHFSLYHNSNEKKPYQTMRSSNPNPLLRQYFRKNSLGRSTETDRQQKNALRTTLKDIIIFYDKIHIWSDHMHCILKCKSSESWNGWHSSSEYDDDDDDWWHRKKMKWK